MHLPQPANFFCHCVLELSPRRIFCEIDTATGQSGAPVFLFEDDDPAPLVVGIHAYGVAGTPTEFNIISNSAPRINDDVFDLISQWVTKDNARLGLAHGP